MRRAVAILACGGMLALAFAGGSTAGQTRDRPLDIKLTNLHTVLVQVVGANAKGRVGPVQGASVAVLPGTSTTTNAGGEAAVTTGESVVAGDTVTIIVKATDFRTAKLRYTIDAKNSTLAYPADSSFRSKFLNWLIGTQAPVTTITLERGSDPAEEQVELQILVKGEDDKPVSSAAVSLCCQAGGKPWVSSWTNGAGEASFYVSLKLIDSGLQARVTADDGRSRFSDITVTKEAGTRIFLVVLPDLPVDLTGQWINPKDPASPAWHLLAGNDYQTLHALWYGGAGHSKLRGTFDGTLDGKTYKGTMSITEGAVHVTGTMTFKILSENKLLMSYKQSNGGGGSNIEMDRKGS